MIDFSLVRVVDSELNSVSVDLLFRRKSEKGSVVYNGMYFSSLNVWCDIVVTIDIIKGRVFGSAKNSWHTVSYDCAFINGFSVADHVLSCISTVISGIDPNACFVIYDDKEGRNIVLETNSENPVMF